MNVKTVDLVMLAKRLTKAQRRVLLGVAKHPSDTHRSFSVKGRTWPAVHHLQKLNLVRVESVSHVFNRDTIYLRIEPLGSQVCAALEKIDD